MKINKNIRVAARKFQSINVACYLHPVHGRIVHLDLWGWFTITNHKTPFVDQFVALDIDVSGLAIVK